MGSVCSARAAQTQSQIGIAVLKQALDLQKAEGEAVLQLLRNTPRPVSVPQPGTGTRVDVSI